MTKSLVIVESPTKARTISAFLSSDATVESSMGHIRDLPRSASEIPARAKGEDWASRGVVGREHVEAHGGRVVLLPLVEGLSTTRIVEAIRNGGGR